MSHNAPSAISVVVPTYNRARLMGATLDSLARQTHRPIEVVVVDDGSTDETEAAVRQWMASAGGLETTYLKTINQGAAAARNAGVEAARHGWVTFLDSDDVAHPDWLAALMGAADGKALTTCGSVRRDAEGRELGVTLPSSRSTVFADVDVNFLCGAYALRRDLFERVGGFDASLPANQHTDLGIRVCDALDWGAGQIGVVEAVKVELVNHGGDKIRSDYDAVYRGTAQFIGKHQGLLARNAPARARYLSLAGRNLYLSGRPAEGCRLLLQAALATPTKLSYWRTLAVGLSGVGRRTWRAQY